MMRLHFVMEATRRMHDDLSEMAEDTVQQNGATSSAVISAEDIVLR